MNIEQLIQLSPVPVRFVHDTGDYLGRYCHDNAHEEWPLTRHIKIVDSLDDYGKISVLVHEIGHAICYGKNCECVKTCDYIMREIHAFEYMLKWLLENKQKESMKWSIKTLKTFLDRYDHYTQVSKHIMKSELWQKCLDYVK